MLHRLHIFMLAFDGGKLASLGGDRYLLMEIYNDANLFVTMIYRRDGLMIS